MFSRATFMPLTAMISSISSEHVAGPMVATIFVRLVLLKPVTESMQFADCFIAEERHTSSDVALGITNANQ